ncbi:MAG TPA: DUF308 domain-containing protein [Nitrososphaeraceae archaeon]
MYLEKRPPWVRALQIGLGAIIIALSIWALLTPADAFVLIVRLLAIILFFVGIERVISGIFLPGKQRFYSIGLGILILILAGIAITYPTEAAAIIIIFIGIALLIIGASRIIEGMSRRHRGFSRGFHVGVGALAVGIGIAIIVFQSFGAALAGVIIAIGLLILGIQMVITGIRSHKLPT